MFDIIAMGELVVDLIDNSEKEDGFIFNGSAGGAPCNVVSQAAKLGLHCAFTGCVGDDMFGNYLIDYIAKQNVDTSHVYKTKKANTTLAFIKRDVRDAEKFSCYRNPGADMMYCRSFLEEDFIKNTKVFHFGSVSLSKEPARSVTFAMLDILEKENVIISYDPNFRFMMWDSKAEAKETAMKALKYCDILKMSAEELRFMTEEDSIEKGVESLKSGNKFKIILVTLGDEGCCYFYKSIAKRIDAFKIDAKDTTAAGDSFFGSFLSRIINSNLDGLSENELDAAVLYANAAGSITASQKGSINILPDDSEIEKMIKTKF